MTHIFGCFFRPSILVVRHSSAKVDVPMLQNEIIPSIAVSLDTTHPPRPPYITCMHSHGVDELSCQVCDALILLFHFDGEEQDHEH